MLVDSHAHIDVRLYDKDRDLRLAERYADVYAALGFHPHNAAKMSDSDLERLAELAQHPKVVAIGETGLDFYRNLSPREDQIEAFKRQLELAHRLELPVIIHCRNAQEEVLSILEEWARRSKQAGQPLGVLHCFSGDIGLAQRYIEMGFLLSIAGPITSFPLPVPLLIPLPMRWRLPLICL